jgi:2-keto-4-pentenoate hydratase/2-oxohepta-3-ene-1,7-dioic acid hydratase in catechol pathway
MKLAALEVDGLPRVVVLSNDVKSYLEIETDSGGLGDMVDLIRKFPDSRAIRTRGAARPIDGHRLRAPIASPRRNIFCVGKNYREHAREFNQSGFDAASAPSEIAPPAPSFFTKPGSSIVGPDEPVLSHSNATKEIDYEVELAVVIGKPGRGIRRKDAYAHVWGYTIVNDVTARDLQKAARQWFLGKSLDTFCPMGPCIVTADEIDPENVDVRTWINGELRQEANTRDLIFDIPTLIETLSAGMALEAGDVIATGTPAGVGIGFQPPKFLRPGDEMRLSISGIGELVNHIQ